MYLLMNKYRTKKTINYLMNELDPDHTIILDSYATFNDDFIINWGVSKGISNACNIINPPHAVNISSHKLRTFRILNPNNEK